jgi:hypothetical protein
MLTTYLHFSVEVENKWNYTCIPPVCLHGLYNDQLIFTFPVWYLSRSLIDVFTTADNPFY